MSPMSRAWLFAGAVAIAGLLLAASLSSCAIGPGQTELCALAPGQQGCWFP